MHVSPRPWGDEVEHEAQPQYDSGHARREAELHVFPLPVRRSFVFSTFP